MTMMMMRYEKGARLHLTAASGRQCLMPLQAGRPMPPAGQRHQARFRKLPARSGRPPVVGQQSGWPSRGD
jgi:hypothetical protein